MENMQLGYDVLSQINPGIIFASISGLFAHSQRSLSGTVN